MEDKNVQYARILPVENVLLLPKTEVRLSVDADQLDWFSNQDEMYVAVLKKDKKGNDFYSKGILFIVNEIIDDQKGTFLSVHLLQRVKIGDVHSFYASYERLNDSEDLDEQATSEMLDYMKKAVAEIGEHFRGGKQFSENIKAYTNMNALMVYLAQFLPLNQEERFRLIDTDSIKERNLLFIDYLLRQRELLKLNIQMNEKFSSRANEYYRKQALKEQLRAIQEELNEDGQDDDSSDYESRIEQSDMPDAIKKVAMEEAKKFTGQEGMEQNIIQNYLEFMLALPWKVDENPSIDLKKAKDILNINHYGLKKVKERILQHLAIMHLKNESQGSAILLVGPPGTGKTSLGKSIAQALDRKYIRMSLGGVRDEAEIRGHRKTYVGAMPGRILQSIKRAGTMNPVLVLDEIDKLSPGGFAGDPTSAMLEVLDPEQNNTFTDHYLDVPYDLSHVFFIATANSLDGIPAPLLDRMEIIQIPSYTSDEKFHIAKEHLLNEVFDESGVPKDRVSMDDSVLRNIIENYTMEAGVRGLKKQLIAIVRKVAESIVEDEDDKVYTIKNSDLEDILGRKVSYHEKAQKDNPPGVVTGLAWTPVGGEILFIETADMPGTGQIILTGQLGDVMKESARISLSLLKSRLPMNAINFKEKDIHIHVPSGATPKDGPSAGITLFTALASLVTGKKVDSKLAMTGEITLRGEVTPIGGLKEKLYGAQRAGIQKVLIPKDNVADLKEVPQEIKDQIQIVPVETVEDVLKETLGIQLPRLEQVLWSGEKVYGNHTIE